MRRLLDRIRRAVVWLFPAPLSYPFVLVLLHDMTESWPLSVALWLLCVLASLVIASVFMAFYWCHKEAKLLRLDQEALATRAKRTPPY